jgi:hypothetical protein
VHEQADGHSVPFEATNGGTIHFKSNLVPKNVLLAENFDPLWSVDSSAHHVRSIAGFNLWIRPGADKMSKIYYLPWVPYRVALAAGFLSFPSMFALAYAAYGRKRYRFEGSGANEP